jgi:hypothetical protein
VRDINGLDFSSLMDEKLIRISRVFLLSHALMAAAVAFSCGRTKEFLSMAVITLPV